jgi:hypothetical protein
MSNLNDEDAVFHLYADRNCRTYLCGMRGKTRIGPDGEVFTAHGFALKTTLLGYNGSKCGTCLDIITLKALARATL